DGTDVAEEQAARNDKGTDGDWHLPVRDERNGEHRLGERHVQEKDNHVEERKRDDQVHDTWLSSRERYKAQRQARAAPRRAKFRARATTLKLRRQRPPPSRESEQDLRPRGDAQGSRQGPHPGHQRGLAEFRCAGEASSAWIYAAARRRR